MRKLEHLKASLRFFRLLPRTPRFVAVEVAELEFELLTLESLSLSPSSYFACFPPLSSSVSDPAFAISGLPSARFVEDLLFSIVLANKAFEYCTTCRHMGFGHHLPHAHARSTRYQSHTQFEDPGRRGGLGRSFLQCVRVCVCVWGGGGGRGGGHEFKRVGISFVSCKDFQKLEVVVFVFSRLYSLYDNRSPLVDS